MTSEPLLLQGTTSSGSVENLRDFRKSLRILEREVELSLLSQTECCGVTPSQCHLLLDVDERREGSIGEFAQALALDTSTLSRTVDGLVRAGFLHRTTDPVNRRRQIITLTAAGEEKVARINRLCDEYYSNILGAIPSGSRRTAVEGVSLAARALGAVRAAEPAPCCPAAGSSPRKE